MAICERFGEAEALVHAGDANHGMDRIDAARGAWQRAYQILEDLGHEEADQVRAKLERVAV